MNNYDDIINVKYPFKSKYTKMKIETRASIFAPFSALSGYAESINEAGRITSKKIELDENRKEIINRKLNLIKRNNFNDEVEIKYFVKDVYKDGGEYITIKSKIKNIDLYNKQIVLIDKKRIIIDDIVDILLKY